MFSIFASMSEIVIPSFGESIKQAVISQWLVKNHDKVHADQVIAVVDSDKVSHDLYAEEEGYINILTAEGESVLIGQIVAHIFADIQQDIQNESKDEDPKKDFITENESPNCIIVNELNFLVDPLTVDEERPLLTRSVMDNLISARLRDNEVPRHVDALIAARDFYEMRISRDYVFRPKARAEVVRLLEVIRELRQCAGSSCSETLEQRVHDILLHEDRLFARMNEKGK